MTDGPTYGPLSGGSKAEAGRAPDPEPSVELLDGFWDVVIYPDYWPDSYGMGDPALWSKERHAWCPAFGLGRKGFREPSALPPVLDRSTSAELRKLSASFDRDACHRCGLKRDQHLIARTNSETWRCTACSCRLTTSPAATAPGNTWVR